jgi:uncharacterized protein with PIN domain
VYAESSAVLAWLFEEESGPQVRQVLAAADIVVASDLTIIECERVLLRAATLGELTEAEAADRRAHLATAAAHWHVLRIGPEIVERARQPFQESRFERWTPSISRPRSSVGQLSRTRAAEP